MNRDERAKINEEIRANRIPSDPPPFAGPRGAERSDIFRPCRPGNSGGQSAATRGRTGALRGASAR